MHHIPTQLKTPNKKITMSTNRGRNQNRVHTTRRQSLSRASSLFEAGELEDAETDESFVLRLNALVECRNEKAEKNVPPDLASAISSSGKPDRRAELVLFGNWLLLDDRPGLDKQPGPSPDLSDILKCVAACLAEMRAQSLTKKHFGTSPGRASRKNAITKHDLMRRWNTMFDDDKKPSDFDKHLRSMKRYLPAYLKHLKSGKACFAGKTLKISPRIEEVLSAIGGGQKHRKIAAEYSKPPVVATPSPFEIKLLYQDRKATDEYRGPIGKKQPQAKLRYECVASSANSLSGKQHADRADKITLVPQVSLREDYKVDSLIDRIAILLNAGKTTFREAIQNTIRDATGISAYAEDLTIKQKSEDWGERLPRLDLTHRTGEHFAIMIQDPTPDVLNRILDAIRAAYGIKGDVKIHMIEVSVDFYPKKGASPEEGILHREKMVGLLQRHHWVPHRLLQPGKLDRMRDIDARQLFGAATVSYLFSDSSRSRSKSDSEIKVPAVRKRILDNQADQEMYLNATLVKGGKQSSHHVSIQHKITNRRNTAKTTMEMLPDAQRRARVEVTLSGREALAEAGLHSIADLARVPFRKMCKPYLTFRLAHIGRYQHLLDDAQIQMRTRGIYGLELRTRALALALNDEKRRTGHATTKQNDREGMGLEDWPEMNRVIGQALDTLHERWRDFSTS